MDIVMDVVNPFQRIYKLFNKVKNCNVICPHILQRYKALENLWAFMNQKQSDHFSNDVKEALEKLEEVVSSGGDLITEFREAYRVTQLWNSNTYKLRFDNLNASVTDVFLTLSGALHADEHKKLDILVLALKKELDERENKLEEQEKKLNEQENKLEEQEKKLDELEKKLDELEKKLDELENKLATYCKE